MHAAGLYYKSSASTAHHNIESTTTTRKKSASRPDPATHPQARSMSPINDAGSPLPLSPLLEQQEGNIAANNRPTDDEVVMAPLSTNSQSFGRRDLRLQNRCILPRVERADGSAPFSRELLELPFSPPTTWALPGHYEPDIDEVVSRYATPTPSQHTSSAPSSPSLSAQHLQAARGLEERSHDYSPFPTPLADAGTPRTSRGLLRVAARQSAAHSSPFGSSGSSQSLHKKYNSVSTFGHPQDMRQYSTFSTPPSSSHLRHKRSSTEPLNEWVEARSPSIPESIQFDQHDRAHDVGKVENWNDQADYNLTDPQSLLASDSLRLGQIPSEDSNSKSLGEPSLFGDLVDVQRPSPREMIPEWPQPPPLSGNHDRSVSEFENFVDVQRPYSPLSSAGSSDFSFVEPSSSPEPAKDILARVERSKSGEQQNSEIKEEDPWRSMIVAAANSDHDELRFPDDDCLPVSTPSESDEQKTAPMQNNERLTETEPEPKPMVEDLANANTHELSTGASSQPRDTPVMSAAVHRTLWSKHSQQRLLCLTLDLRNQLLGSRSSSRPRSSSIILRLPQSQTCSETGLSNKVVLTQNLAFLTTVSRPWPSSSLSALGCCVPCCTHSFGRSQMSSLFEQAVSSWICSLRLHWRC